MMTTLCRRAFVSIATTMILTLAMDACATDPSRGVRDRSIGTADRLLSIRFDNLSVQTVDVYLIGTKHEWMLGRIAPGAVASLRLPDEAFTGGSMRVRLAVLAGQPVSFAAARDARTVMSIAEPASALLSQRWTFSQGSVTAVQY